MAEELINTSLFLDANLKAYYRFEEADFLNDRSSSGLNLTNYNSVSNLSTGKFGACADFGSSNTNKYLQAPNGIVSSFTGDFTIMFWFYWVDNGNYSRFFDFGSDTNNYFMITPKNSVNSKIRYVIKIGAGSDQVLDSAAACPTNTWTHLVLTRYSGTHYLYINGVLSASTAGISNVLSGMGNTTQNYIGKSQFAVDPYFCGYQDDFAIFDRGLSPAEVSSFYNYYLIYPNTAVRATGGTETYFGNRKIHTFTSSGDFIVTEPGVAEVLVVAGGGGGGIDRAGGGGAGGVLYNSSLAISSNTFSVVVGSGGSGSVANVRGGNGGNSIFSTLTAIGGGGGGTGSGLTGSNGGSGGGGGNSGAVSPCAGGTGTSGQGYAGGQGVYSSPNYGAGGGGGAGGVGSNGTSTSSGNGGAGVSTYSTLLQSAGAGVNISGTYWIAGGGGAGSYDNGTHGIGGNGGGGNGGYLSCTSGAANTGGGGGSAGNNAAPKGGDGGSGIVIISYTYQTPNTLKIPRRDRFPGAI